MKIKNQFSIFLLTFLVVGLFSLALTVIEASALALPAGCCRTSDDAFCLGCVSGCSATESYCEAQGGIFIGSEQACVDPFGDCGSVPEDSRGCCLRADNLCSEDRTFDECFQAEEGQFWVADESCSFVSDCQEARPIPTISEWGLIAMAGFFVLIGIWGITRKKAVA